MFIKGYKQTAEHKLKSKLARAKALASGVPMGMTGKKHSEESKEKMSESQKIRFKLHPVINVWNKDKHLSEETKRKISEIRKRAMTNERRMHLSNIAKQKIFTPEHRANLSKALKGRKCPWAWKIHEKTRGRKQSQEEIEKRVSQFRGKNHWLYGKTHTDEVKKKISQTHKGKHISEVHKAKISKYLKTHPEHPGLIYWKGKKHTEEYKNKMSAKLKGRIITWDNNPRSKNTSIELKLQSWLKEQGIEFETNYPILGRPDIFIKPNICIFADGCYWHKCPTCGMGEGTQRDHEVTVGLQKQGYTVIRLWEHQINSNQFGELSQLLK